MAINYGGRFNREVALNSLRRIAEEPDCGRRYARVAGVCEALLEADPEMVEAIEAASRGPQRIPADRAGQDDVPV